MLIIGSIDTTDIQKILNDSASGLRIVLFCTSSYPVIGEKTVSLPAQNNKEIN
jgi:hypothetical protein